MVEINTSGLLGWLHKYKIIFEIVLGFLSIGLLIWQLQQLAESDRAAAEQTQLLSKQVEAIWYGYKPELAFLSPSENDIVPYSGEFTFKDYTTSYEALLDKQYELKFRFENVGLFAATLDTICFEVAWRDLSIADTVDLTGLTVSPKKSHSFRGKVPVLKNKRNWVSIDIVYRWERRDLPDERYTIAECRLITFERGQWNSTIYPCKDFPTGIFAKDTT